MMYTIYQHLNEVNGKGYIGYTKYDISKRFQNHVSQSKRNSMVLFHKAIRKYGNKCWTSKSLAICETLTEARELEKKFIFEYKTNERGLGYNMTEGGEGNVNKGIPLSPEHRLKVIAALRRHVWTPEEYKERGKKQRGRKRSVESRKAISDGMKKARQNGLTKAQKLHLQRLHAATKGMKRSVETKNKMSLSAKGKPKSEEHKQALRAPKTRKK